MKWTKEPWYTGCFVNPDSKCQCRSILCESYAGSVAMISVDNGIHSISEGGNDCPPLDEARANADRAENHERSNEETCIKPGHGRRGMNECRYCNRPDHLHIVPMKLAYIEVYYYMCILCWIGYGIKGG